MIKGAAMPLTFLLGVCVMMIVLNVFPPTCVMFPWMFIACPSRPVEFRCVSSCVTARRVALHLATPHCAAVFNVSHCEHIFKKVYYY